MTCIAALVENNTVYMGGDSAGIAGLSITVRSDEKVFINGPFIIGITGSFRMSDLLRYKLDPPKQTVHRDDRAYLVTDFVDSLRKCFSANGFGDKEATVGGTFLLGYKGTLYSVQKDYQIGIPSTQYDAVGCGADLALGSLHSTAKLNLKPEQRITMALEAASTFSAGVSPPFLVMKQEYKDPEAPKKKSQPATSKKNKK
jgi:20S proteasome alpha/beta subunit